VKIDIDNYSINTDSIPNVYITERKINEKTGKEYEARVSGYHHSLRDALKSMLERKVYGSDVTNVTEAINKIDNALNDALKILSKEKEI